MYRMEKALGRYVRVYMITRLKRGGCPNIDVVIMHKTLFIQQMMIADLRLLVGETK